MIPDFNIINPVTNNKMPFFDKKKGIFYFKVANDYKYYIEASQMDEYGTTQYYILLGKIKFDNNCRKCHVDDYRRCQIRPKGELLNYILNESKERSNFNVTFVENREIYNVFKID